MRKLLALLLVLALASPFSVMGCKKKGKGSASGSPSGSGSPSASGSPSDSGSTKGNGKEGKITLTAPEKAVEVKAGDTAKVTVKVKREKYEGDVMLKVTPPDTAKDMKVSDVTVKKGDDEGKIEVKTDKKTKKGEYEFTVVGSGKDGKPKSDEAMFTVKVSDK